MDGAPVESPPAGRPGSGKASNFKPFKALGQVTGASWLLIARCSAERQAELSTLSLSWPAIHALQVVTLGTHWIICLVGRQRYRANSWQRYRACGRCRSPQVSCRHLPTPCGFSCRILPKHVHDFPIYHECLSLCRKASDMVIGHANKGFNTVKQGRSPADLIQIAGVI